MISPPTDSTRCVAVLLRLSGRVQGLGVRPAVARLAKAHALAGSVRNSLRGVEVVLEGPGERIAAFSDRLPAALPAGCETPGIEQRPIAVAGRSDFLLVEDGTDGPLATPVPPDVAVCSECLAESVDPADRRYAYPLSSCAACGPRYTIVRAMPYERRLTAMADFLLCRDCREEFASTRDRRFHAQTTTCGACGPRIWATGASSDELALRQSSDGLGATAGLSSSARTVFGTAGQASSGTRQTNSEELLGRDGAATAAAVAALCSGKIVALRGVGGYQLLCDATRDDAVRRLRRRKDRPAKPLAILVDSVAAAEQLAVLDAAERQALRDPANPIVLVQHRADGGLAESVHPGLDVVGLMLPATPLHHAIARAVGRPLVCTSGNLEGEPIVFDADTAGARLAGIADVCLHHDRPIVRPIDDSVVRIIAGRRVTIRLGRGLAPLTLELPAGVPTLALGGHLKSAAAWCNGAQCVLGPHVGDLETAATRRRLRDHLEDGKTLYRFEPQHIVHDLHPGYFTTALARESPLPRVAVQHHLAHVAAGMLEHQLLDRDVLGVAWDGTGLGTDDTVWGGEFLLVRGTGSYRRVAHLRPFVLPGGEAAVRQPWRVAASVLSQAMDVGQLRAGCAMLGCERERLTALLPLLDNPRLSTTTTSAGRLFDAAACLILGIAESAFEGHAAMLLEAVADRTARGSYRIPLSDDGTRQLDWRPMFARLWADRGAGVPPAVMAMRFHRALADGIVAVAGHYPRLPLVLGGGVFQNRLLTELIVERLGDDSRLMLPGRIPPGDGGLAAGQLALAMSHAGGTQPASPLREEA